MASKVMFRGDRRHPVVNDSIFTNGFSKRDATFANPAYRSAGPDMSGDLDPDSGVCVSVRFQGAALFPLKFDNTDPKITTYVYAVVVDTGLLLNTHAQQVKDSLGQKVGTQWINPNAADNAAWSTDSPMWPLFAHEMAINSIPAGDIVCAIKCDRTWTGASWDLGGTYQLGNIFHNPGCTAAAQFAQAARDFVGGEFSNHRNSPLPNGMSGFHL